MSFFKQPKPRRFHHEPIYYDEHSDRVRNIKERAREELGGKQDGRVDESKIKEAFSGATPHLRRYENRRTAASWVTGSGALLVIILVLLLVWIYLSR